MKTIQIAIISGFLVVLTGCGIGGMAGPFPGHSEFVGESDNNRFNKKLAPSQVVYRIDENRYFEYVPYDKLPCARAELFYTDKAQGIHTQVALTGNLSTKGSFIIDAENTDYLVGPIIRANGNCGADTADLPSCSKRLPYSTDQGRTWKYVTSFGGDSVALVGSIAYSFNYSLFYYGGFLDLKKLNGIKKTFLSTGWEDFYSESDTPLQPRKFPQDTQFHCNDNERN